MNPLEAAIAAVVFSSVSGAISAAIGARRERARDGALLGIFLGPVGWLLALGLRQYSRCRSCLGTHPAAATACWHCGTERGGTTFTPQRAPVAGSESGPADELSNAARRQSIADLETQAKSRP